MKTIAPIITLLPLILCVSCAHNPKQTQSAQLDLGGITGAVSRAEAGLTRAQASTKSAKELAQRIHDKGTAKKSEESKVLVTKIEEITAAHHDIKEANTGAKIAVEAVRVDDATRAAALEKAKQKIARLELVAGRWHGISVVLFLAGGVIFAAAGLVAKSAGWGSTGTGPVGWIVGFLVRFLPIEYLAGAAALLAGAAILRSAFWLWGLFG